MPCNYLTKITRKDRKGRSLYKPRHKTWGPVTFSEAPLCGILQQNFPPAPLQFGCSKGGHLVLMQKTSNLTTFQHLQRGAKWFLKGINSPSLSGWRTFHPEWKVSRFVVVVCSPPVRWGLLDFMSVSSPPPPVLLLLLLPRPPPVAILWVQCGVPGSNRELVSSVWRAGPQPRSCEFSVACRTPTAILRVQCGVPDPNCDPASSVWRAGPQLRSCEFSVACRTPTASSWVQCGVPDPNRDPVSSVWRAGPQVLCQKICQKEWQKICQKDMSEDMSERMSKDMSERCQKECQKICQKECQKICQKECQNICQEECQKISQK